jgi:hypothetical protein
MGFTVKVEVYSVDQEAPGHSLQSRSGIEPKSRFSVQKYWTISFKSTGGVTRDPFYLFDILAAAEFLRDTSKISAFEPQISPFSLLFFFFF